MGARKKLKLLHKTARTPSKEVMAGWHQQQRSSLRIAEAVSRPIIITDSDYQVLYLNSRAEAFLGYGSEELLGEQLDEQFSVQSGHETSSAIHTSDTGPRFSGERKSGEAFDVAAHCQEVNAGDERLRVISFGPESVIFKDSDSFSISEAIREAILHGQMAAERIRESEERFRMVAELSPNGICVQIDGTIVFMNAACAGILGAKNPDDLIGMKMIDFVPRDDRQAVVQWIKDAIMTRKPTPFVEQRRIRPDGTIVEVEVACVALRYIGRDAVQIVTRNITERKRIQQALRESEEKYRTIVENQTELVCQWTPDGILTFVNEAYCRYFDKSVDELIGRSFMSLIPETSRRSVQEHFDSFTPQLPVQTHVHQVLAPNGEVHWHQWTNRAIFDDRGRILEFQSVGSDITDLKRVQDQLQYRLEFERIIMSLSSRFISIAPAETGENILHVLSTVGGFTNADRCYVFRLSDDEKTMDNTHEWCARGIAPQINELQGLPVEAFAYSLRMMMGGEVFHVPRVADLPEDAAAEKAEFEREKIQSLICVPMLRQGKIIGFMGLDSVRCEKTWSSDEIALLKIIGEMLTTALEREQTEQALRESEQKYRSFVQNFQGIAYRARMDWIPLFFNGAVESLTGYTEADFVAGSPRWDQLIHPDDWPDMTDSVHKIATVPNYSTQREYRIIRKDKQIRWIHEQIQNICDESGEPIFVQGSIYDVTDRKLAAEKLAASEQRFRTMADFTYDWEYWLGADGSCVYVSPSIETTTGYRAAEFEKDVGLLQRITHPEDLPALDKHMADKDEPGKVTLLDFRITTRDGEERWINHVCQPVYAGDGTFLGRRASNRDITDRKHAEEAVRRERDRAQRYLDVAGTILLALDKGGRVVLINRKGCQILGCGELDVVGRNWFDHFLPPSYRDEAREVFEKLINSGSDSAEYFECPVITRNTKERVIAWYNTVIEDDTGEIKGTLSSGLDITERQHMERVQSALFEISEATNLTGSLEELLGTIHKTLGRLIDTTNFYVALYDSSTDTYTFPYLVDEYHKSADLEPEQLKKTFTDYVRRTGTSLLADEKKDLELQALGEVAVVGHPSKVWLGVPLITSQRVIGVVAVQSYTDPSTYQESDMDLMTFVSRHISMAVERKLAEEALRESEEHYRSLVETMNEGLAVCDNNNIIMFANRKFCDMLGYTSNEVLNSNLLDYLDQENQTVISSLMGARTTGTTEPYELEWTRRVGNKVTTIVSPVPVRDATGSVAGSVAVITDISERKRAEDKLRQATELLRTEREALTQKNIALKEILDHIEKERQNYKQSICRDVGQAVEPLMTKLKLIANGERARDIEALETQLDALLAKDVDVFRNRYAKLSPRELEVCDLIKAKMSSKEISERLNVSLLTVHKHREQIRRKLGITSKGINLSAYLQSH
ncbi:MAG: PAS domain S-box protein [Candidatus Zixiibacteriota bacterium]|nr:MAG: PAS domain S-box protein [candidate division Zixibacteria bacterium]